MAVPLPLWAAQCAVDPLAQYTKMGGDPSDNRVHVEADTSEGDFFQSDFAGSVKVRQGDKHLLAPKASYYHDDGLLKALDGVTVGMPTAAIVSEEGVYHLNENQVDFSRSDYYLIDKVTNANGSAASATFNRDSNIDTFEDVTYTTCDRGDPVWQLRASDLTLDHNENRAVAHHATFRIQDTPVLYLPYFSFPLNGERATGFLMPSFGTSDDRGFELTVPFYWNIAPNQDATFALRPMTKRGVMLEGQYRYLDENQYLELGGSWLPNDQMYDDNQRWRIGALHRYQFSPNWRSEINYQAVSDINYLEDMDGGLSLYDDWYLDRYAAIYGKGDWGNVMFKVQDYERVSPDVKESETPYSRLPQVLYTNRWLVDDFTFSLKGEGVRFHKDDDGSAERYNLNGMASYRLGESYGYIEPAISLDMAHYDFHPDNNSFRDGAFNRALPTISVDGQLVFERDMTLGGEGYTQTLEPRLFYLYTPYKDQSDIPLFDTSETSESWNWLFARNRFTGGDRISDANQLTTALTTRFYRNSDGQERGKLSFGQIQYFQDRRVGLNGNVEKDTSRSVLVTEGEYNIDSHWRLYGLSFWDPNDHRNKRDVLDLSYHLDQDRYLGIGHRYKRNDYDQISFRGGWRVNTDWRLFARHDYSLLYHQDYNTMLGVEYSDCCWAWRLVGRHYRNEPEDRETNTGVYLEFIFKGLGNMGSETGSMLSSDLREFRPLPEERVF